MFKKIKYILYKKGYLKLDTITSKIDYLICSRQVNLIHSDYYEIYIKTLESDIVKHLKTLEMFNIADISGDKIDYGIQVKSITLAEWFSNDGFILENKGDIERWLIECKKIIIKTEMLVDKITTGNEYHNFKLLKNLYSDVNNIIEILFKIYQPS